MKLMAMRDPVSYLLGLPESKRNAIIDSLDGEKLTELILLSAEDVLSRLATDQLEEIAGWLHDRVTEKKEPSVKRAPKPSTVRKKVKRA